MSKNVIGRKWTGKNQLVILGFSEFVFKFPPFPKMFDLVVCSWTDQLRS